jgi:hypothetical protein
MNNIPKASELLAATEQAREQGAKQLREAAERIYTTTYPKLLTAMATAASNGKDSAGWELEQQRHPGSRAENEAGAERVAAELRTLGYSVTVTSHPHGTKIFVGWAHPNT